MRRQPMVLVLAAVVTMLITAGCARTVAGQAHAAPGAVADAGPAGPSSSAPPPLVLSPLVPGWSPVRSVKRAAVYDVPPGWRIPSESTIIGFESPDGTPRRVASGAAIYGEGACGSPRANLAESVVTHGNTADVAGFAAGAAHDWADAGYRDDADRPPAVTLSPAETITTLTGQPATVVKAEAVVAAPSGACGISRGAAWAVAATGFHGELGPTVILVIVVDEQDAKAQNLLPEPVIRQILSTLRPQP